MGSRAGRSTRRASSSAACAASSWRGTWWRSRPSASRRSWPGPLLQCRVDELADLRGRVLDADRELAPVRLRDLAVAREDLGEPRDDRQRGAQIVAQPAAGLAVEDQIVVAGVHEEPVGAEMKPSRRAIAIACTRVLASSLFMALRMWVLIVSGLR